MAALFLSTVVLLNNVQSSYVGCYNDQGERAMTGVTSDGTWYGCCTACSSYQYYALQNGHACSCSSDLSQITKYGVCDGSSWSSPTYGGPYARSCCTNQGSYYTGGSWTNAVYSRSGTCPNTPRPTPAPTTKRPTPYPTKYPTKRPTPRPTPMPTPSPTEYPTGVPTKTPSNNPTKAPATDPTGTVSTLYFRGPELLTWTAAEEYCVSQGTHLASIHDETENSAAFSVCEADGNDVCWIGSNNNVASWTDGTSPSGFTYWQSPAPRAQYPYVLLWHGGWAGGPENWTQYPLCNAITECTDDVDCTGDNELCSDYGQCECDTDNGYVEDGNGDCVDETTAAPSSSPTATERCEAGVNYAIEGIGCTGEGDPHITMFNGARHHFQGQNNGQYYYVHPCSGVSDDDMPFKILGNQQGYTVTQINHLILELYESSTEQYLVYVGTYVTNGYINIDDTSGSTLYENNSGLAGYNGMSSTQSIGSRFKIVASGNHYTLTIDDECEVKFHISRSTMTIEPSECYRCLSCGLCGDFKSEKVTSGYQTIETCDGGYVQIKDQGWGNTDPFTYSDTGNTWERDECNGRRRRLQTTGEIYIPEVPTGFIIPNIEDLCNVNISSMVISKCQSARDDAAVCCDTIGDDGQMCDNLQSECDLDACIMTSLIMASGIATGNATTWIDYFVQEYFTDAIELICSIDGVSDLYDSNNLIAVDTNTEIDIAYKLSFISTTYVSFAVLIFMMNIF